MTGSRRMGSLINSKAYYNPLINLTQHQSALTLLHSSLENPKLSEYHWLDLACGKGQIITLLRENIPDEEMRSKIAYYPYDINNDYIKQVERTAKTLNLGSCEPTTSEIAHFPKIYGKSQKFDFISFTNTVHELKPQAISTILFECVIRLASEGSMYVYDMEGLTSGPELGAIPWQAAEMKEVLETFFLSLGITQYSPTPQRWIHSTCSGWSIHIQRKYIEIEEQKMEAAREHTINEMATRMASLLTQKLNLCKKALESLTTCGTTTREEEQNKMQLLYDFWALSRAKEVL